MQTEPNDCAALADELERAREYVASSMHDRDKSWGDLVLAGERDDCPEMRMVLKAMRTEALRTQPPAEPRCGDEGAPLCHACSQPINNLTQVPGCGGPLPTAGPSEAVDAGDYLATLLQRAVAGKPIRDMTEALAAWESTKAALSTAPRNDEAVELLREARKLHKHAIEANNLFSDRQGARSKPIWHSVNALQDFVQFVRLWEIWSRIDAYLASQGES